MARSRRPNPSTRLRIEGLETRAMLSTANPAAEIAPIETPDPTPIPFGTPASPEDVMFYTTGGGSPTAAPRRMSPALDACPAARPALGKSRRRRRCRPPGRRHHAHLARRPDRRRLPHLRFADAGRYRHRPPRLPCHPHHPAQRVALPTHLPGQRSEGRGTASPRRRVPRRRPDRRPLAQGRPPRHRTLPRRHRHQGNESAPEASEPCPSAPSPTPPATPSAPTPNSVRLPGRNIVYVQPDHTPPSTAPAFRTNLIQFR